MCLLIFILYILCFPKDALDGATFGLLLWYSRVLPTLLPFSILCNILIDSNYITYITRMAAPLLRLFLPVSENGAFVVISGFLFGFPMGSKSCAELLKRKAISKEEGEALFAITNNISPVFINSFVLRQQLHMPKMALISLLILYLPPLILGHILLRRAALTLSKNAGGDRQKKPASGSQMNFKIIDAGIMNGFETLTKLGGYIMLFSMLAFLLKKLPIPYPIYLCLTGATEITTGISLLGNSPLGETTRYILAISFTAFGGLSGLAQASSIVRDTALSVKSYLAQKLLLTAVSTLLAAAIAFLLA
ncbi:MAG: nucleoside recognition domain-containing protein [Roseburia sp.]